MDILPLKAGQGLGGDQEVIGVTHHKSRVSCTRWHGGLHLTVPQSGGSREPFLTVATGGVKGFRVEGVVQRGLGDGGFVLARLEASHDAVLLAGKRCDLWNGIALGHGGTFAPSITVGHACSGFFHVSIHLGSKGGEHCRMLVTDILLLTEISRGSGFIIDAVELNFLFMLAATTDAEVTHQFPRAFAHGDAHLAVHREVPEDRLTHAAVRLFGRLITTVKLADDVTTIQIKGGVLLDSGDFHEGGE